MQTIINSSVNTGAPAEKLPAIIIPVVKIWINTEKVNQSDFYHITLIPKRKPSIGEFPIRVNFNVNGQLMPGWYTDVTIDSIFNIPSFVIKDSHGMSKLEFICELLDRMKAVKTWNKELIIWKCEMDFIL